MTTPPSPTPLIVDPLHPVALPAAFAVWLQMHDGALVRADQIIEIAGVKPPAGSRGLPGEFCVRVTLPLQRGGGSSEPLYRHVAYGPNERWTQEAALGILDAIMDAYTSGTFGVVRWNDDSGPMMSGYHELVRRNGADEDHLADELVEESAWTVDLAEQVLRTAQPHGSTFLRALINEGGTATAQRLKELTGTEALHYMTLTVNAAVKKVTGSRTIRGGRQLAIPRADPANPRAQRVYDYHLPADLVPVFDDALRRLGR
jgi:hypothetical protein